MHEQRLTDRVLSWTMYEAAPLASFTGPTDRGAVMVQPGPAAKQCRGKRSMFPLPFFACSPRESECSRTVKQRRDRIRHHVENCNKVIHGLNWLSGQAESGTGDYSCDALQQQVLVRVDGLEPEAQ